MLQGLATTMTPYHSSNRGLRKHQSCRVHEANKEHSIEPKLICGKGCECLMICLSTLNINVLFIHVLFIQVTKSK